VTDDMRIESLEDAINDVQRTLYGNNREKNGGGLYEQVVRQEQRIAVVERAITRPAGWTTLIIVGGVASLLLHIITLATLVALISVR